MIKFIKKYILSIIALISFLSWGYIMINNLHSKNSKPILIISSMVLCLIMALLIRAKKNESN